MGPFDEGTSLDPVTAGSARTADEALRTLGSNVQQGLATPEARDRLTREGANEVPEREAQPLLNFARKFWGLSAWMIELIALLSLLLRKYADLSVALGLLVVNAFLSSLQEHRASSAVAALRRKLQVIARVLRDGAWQGLPARELVPGDIVRLRTGDFVPADIRIFDGDLKVDQSMLTGESREQRKTRDDLVYSGTIVRQGEATAIVVATGAKTFFGRTTVLVQGACPKLHVEEIVSRLVQWLLIIVGAQVALAMVVSLINGLPILEIVPLSLVLLMSAVPVALPVMFTVSMALGSMELARRGVLITQLSAAEDAANMDILCVDKTGTLTMNRLSLTGLLPQAGFNENDVIRAGALASQEADQDPIDMAFLETARGRRLIQGSEKKLVFMPFSPSTRRTEATVQADGRVLRVMKGALRSVAQVSGLEETEIARLEEDAFSKATLGVRILAVARAENDGPWRLVGLAILRDAPRPDSRQMIAHLRSLGITVKMLTGDALPVARSVAQELGIGEIAKAPNLRPSQTGTPTISPRLALQADGFAEVFPEDKFLIVKSLQATGHVVGMTGDGVNDAPALRQAEVGIAVSDSTDVAKGAASVVLVNKGLSNIVDLVENGRAIYQRVLTWIINKVSRTILKSGFVVIAFLVTGRFVISALAMVLLVFMTDFVKVALSTDLVRPSRQPETWNIGPLVRIAVILGLLMLAEALGLLAIGWHAFDLGRTEGELQTFTFLTLLFFALFSIVSIRERSVFWGSRPSWILVLALLADACAGVMIGINGLAELRPLPPSQIGFILVYTSVTSLLVNDGAKCILMDRMWNNRRTVPGGRLSKD